MSGRSATSPVRPAPAEAPAGALGWGYVAFVFLAVAAAYGPALRSGFVWDDDAHVTPVALRSWAGLARIWFRLGATQQYYPVLHSAFWLEHRWWGDAAAGYHLANVVLHATAACLFALVLRRLAVPGARLAGAVFALHPVGVESVAWIAEEKNTLSLVCYLLAALAYFRFEGKRGREAAGPYLLATALFVLALLSKSVTATLPAALLVVAWWRRGAVSWRGDVRPLLPWFGIGGAAGLLTAWVERHFIGAAGADFALTLPQRCLLAGRVVWFYLGKLAWPANLIFIYPRWRVPAEGGSWIVFPAAVLALTGLLWLGRRRGRGPLAAWLLYIGSLFPALGFFNVYPFLFSYVADHFQYLASLSVIALAGAGAAEGLSRMPPAIRGGGRVLAAGLLLGLGVLTWRQCLAYRDGATLYAATLERNPAAWLAHLNLGNLALEQGRTEEAIGHYREAERLEPAYPSTHFNLARIWLQEGRLPEAIAELEADLRLMPADAEARNNLGVALAESGRPAEAEPQFLEALRLRPDYPRARANLDQLRRLAPPAHP
jgi:tetratricopeptide (TPR) repeat protein